MREGVYTEAHCAVAAPCDTADRTAGQAQGGLIMASSTLAPRREPSSRRGPPSSNASTAGQAQRLNWIPIALGAAAIAAGLTGRKKGAAALALGAFAGAAAVGAVPGVRPVLAGKRHGDAAEVERSITIGKSEDELRRFWLDPRTLPQIMAGFATVRATGDARMHWQLEDPLGGVHAWETETVDAPGADIGWRSLADGAMRNEGSIRLRPAGAGTVVTLRLLLHPPGGALGSRAVERLGATPLHLAIEGALRRFKNLVETGEIPTTARQPAARADTE
jgi:uncharacterized membrane protein